MERKCIGSLENQGISNIRVLVDISDYDIKQDTRLLIPFSYFQYYGLMNQSGEIVVEPKFDRIVDSCRKESDLIRVGIYYTYGFNRSTKDPATFHRMKFGLVDSFGSFILEPEYKGIGISADNRILTIQHMDGAFEVITTEGEVIVPKGIYQWVDSFDRGFARVHALIDGKKKYGLIDSQGNEVLPIIYSSIWNFYKKNRTWVTIETIDEFGNRRVGKFDFITRKATI